MDMQIDTTTQQPQQNTAIIICTRASRPGNDMSLEIQRLSCMHYIKDTGRDNLHIDSIAVVHSSQDLQWLTHKAGDDNKWLQMNQQFAIICSLTQFNRLVFMFSCVDRFLRQNINELVILQLLINLQEWTRQGNTVVFEFVDEKKTLEFAGSDHHSEILNRFEQIKTELQAASIEFEQIRKRQKRSRDFLAKLGYKFGRCPKCFDVVFEDTVAEGSQEPVRVRKFQLKPAIIKLLVAAETDIEPLLQLQSHQFTLLATMGLVNQQMEQQMRSSMKEYAKPLIIKAKKIKQQILKQMQESQLRQIINDNKDIQMIFSAEEMLVINGV